MSLPDESGVACNTHPVIVDVAVYEHGKRLDRVLTPAEALACAQAGAGRFTWIGMSQPSEAELDEVAELFELHPLAIEDALHAHQRPKLERYDSSLFVVLKTLRYVDHDEVFDFGEVMLFVGVDYVVTVRHGDDCGLPAVRRELEADPGAPGDRTGRGAPLDRRPRRRPLRERRNQHRRRHRRDPGAGVRGPDGACMPSASSA